MTSDIQRDSVGLADLVSPVALLHRVDGKLVQDDGSVDTSGSLLASLLNTQTDKLVVVPHGDKCLEPSLWPNVDLPSDGQSSKSWS